MTSACARVRVLVKEFVMPVLKSVTVKTISTCWLSSSYDESPLPEACELSLCADELSVA